MQITPLFSDSMGVRSMATVVKLRNEKIFIDPSAALGPYRYGFPPHKRETEMLNYAKHRISETAQDCNYLIITHYHYDHHDPLAEYFNNKTIYTKSIFEFINKSQQKRGEDFQQTYGNTSTIIYSDSTVVDIDNHIITFSPPFPHGPEGIRLGYVIMVGIEGDKKLLFSSDVQGPVSTKTKEYILSYCPDILIMDGPPTYFLGWRFSQANLDMSIANLLDIMNKTNCKLILDHHLLRDLNYKKRMKSLYYEYGDHIFTFAEWNGQKNNQLEANRKKLWSVNNKQ